MDWKLLPGSTPDVAIFGWGDGMIEATATRDDIAFAGAYTNTRSVDYEVFTPEVIEAALDALQPHLEAYWQDDPLSRWGKT